MTENEKSEGFNFVIALLVAFGTIIYTAYSFFQIRAVDNDFYVTIVGVITILLISSFFLIVYIFVKGYSMETQYSEKRKTMENFASHIYSETFWAGLISLILVVGTFLLIIAGQWTLVLSLYFIIGVVVTFYKFYKLRLPYLFCWGKIPGSDNRKLIDFLKQNFGIDWVKKARIEKIYNDTTITVSTDNNYLSLMLNSEETKANLMIDNIRTDEFIVKRKRGELNPL